MELLLEKLIFLKEKLSQSQWEDSLTERELKALRFFTTGGYLFVHRTETSKRTHYPEKMERLINDFFKAIEKAPLYHGTIYRGSKFGSDFPYKNVYKDTIFYTDRTLSFSKNLSVAKRLILEFNERISPKQDYILKLKTKSGVDISNLGAKVYHWQEEVLQRKGSRIKVVDNREEIIQVEKFGSGKITFIDAIEQ